MAENSDSLGTSDDNVLTLSNSSQNSESYDIQKENVMKPILLEDYSYEESPVSLQKLMHSLENRATSPSRIDILVNLIYLLILESGFVPYNYTGPECSFDFHYKRVLALSKDIRLECNGKNYVSKLILPNLQQFEVLLVIITSSDDLIVNCFVKGIESGSFNILLDPLKYFTSSSTDLSKVKFQYLDHLSRLVKDTIAFPVKYSILKQNRIAMPCLEDLPGEILLIIMKKIPLNDLKQLGNVNDKFGVLAQILFKKFGKKMQ